MSVSLSVWRTSKKRTQSEKYSFANHIFWKYFLAAEIFARGFSVYLWSVFAIVQHLFSVLEVGVRYFNIRRAGVPRMRIPKVSLPQKQKGKFDPSEFREKLRWGEIQKLPYFMGGPVCVPLGPPHHGCIFSKVFSVHLQWGPPQSGSSGGCKEGWVGLLGGSTNALEFPSTVSPYQDYFLCALLSMGRRTYGQH